MSRTVCIIDTSVFCNILRVPNKSQDYEQAIKELNAYIEAGDTLLLPMATIYETGNHIAQNGDGQKRREVAQNFVEQVRQAFTGEAPWTPTPLHNADEFVRWLAEFPDAAMRGVSLGDLAIIKLFERQCELNPGRRVLIWSYDRHLAGYNRGPKL
jgi:hypothetical protein